MTGVLAALIASIIVASSAAIIIKAAETPECLYRAVHLTDLRPGRSWAISYEGSLLLGAGDRVSFDVIVASGGGPLRWLLEVEVIDPVKDDKYYYSNTFIVPRPPTPYFTAPSPGIYDFMVSINVTSNADKPIEVSITVTIACSNNPRSEVVDRAYALTAFTIAVLALSNVLAKGSWIRGRLARLIEWELGSAAAWVIAPVIAFFYILTMVELGSAVGRELVILWPISFKGDIGFLVIFAVMASVAALLLIAHKWELGLEATLDAVGVSRLLRFTAKLAAMLLLLYAPIALPAVMVYLLWLPGFVIHEAGRIASLLALELMFYLALTCLFTSTPLIVAYSTRSAAATLIAGTLVPLALIIDSPVKELAGVDLAKLIELMDPGRLALVLGRGVPGVDVDGLASPFSVFLVSVLISLAVYLRRESL